MEFEKQEYTCLQTIVREWKDQEQTQEVRIGEGLPDIGSILATWGQVILRSKEWQGDGIAVSGGTMVWVQYLPEGGGDPCCVECWLPFQMRWSFPPRQYDGKIITRLNLRTVDARSLSARKMMVRANVSVLGWAMEKESFEFYIPGEIPQDVHLRKDTYPMLLAVETGEKAFDLEEPLMLPASSPPMEQILRCSMHPRITEEKMLGDKLVFRGNAGLHVLYRGSDGGLHTCDLELPFTQYSELEREYGEGAQIMIWPVITALETEKEADTWQVKAGLVCQYRICDRKVVELVSDTYSTCRSVVPAAEDLELPGLLEMSDRSVPVRQSGPSDCMRIVDSAFLPYPVQDTYSDDTADLKLSGLFQLLYMDIGGELRSDTQKWEVTQSIPTGQRICGASAVELLGIPHWEQMPGSSQLTAQLKLESEFSGKTGVSMITALDLGEAREPDPNRPSVILRRRGDASLWDLAKRCGSTVEAIMEANDLQAEPESSCLLLIPVI